MLQWLPLLAALALPAPSSLLFERATPAFTLFTTGEGLPQNTAAALAVDAQGHLWVGTQGGLVVREGREFRPIALPGDKGAVIVTAILPAADGTLWVATFGDGVFRRRGGRWEHLAAGLPSPEVRTLGEAQGSIWAGTNAGLARLSGDERQWTPVVPPVRLAEPGVAAVTRTADPEALWVGTDSGLLRLQEGKWTLFDRDAGLPDNRVRSLLETRTPAGPVLWVGTEGGLAHLHRGAVSAEGGEGLPAFPVYALAETRDARGEASLWVATYGGGVAVLRGGAFRVFDKRGGLPGNLVMSIAVVEEGPGRSQLWFGCEEGLARLALGLPDGDFRGFPDGPQFLREKSNALAVVDAGPSAGVWVASDAGLHRFQQGAWSELRLPVRKDDRPYSFLEERAGTMLVGTVQGQLVRVGPKGAALVPFPAETGNSVRSMAEVDDPARGPELWVARRNGLLVQRQGRWVSYDTSSGLKGNWHFKVAATPGRTAAAGPTVWVGGWAGLARFDGARFSSQDSQDGLPANLVTSILQEEREGRQELWLGTASGAVRYDAERAKVLEVFSPRAGPPLPSWAIYTIQADRQGRHYLCTDKGVVRLSSAAGGPSAFTFGREDGLPSPECVERGSAVDSAGRLWVATTGGIAVHEVQPEVPAPRAARPLVLERTLLRGEERELEGATLSHAENAVRFDYALLGNFRDGETRYRTQLLGAEETPTDWTTDAKREFSTLPPGSYELRVWARDYAGTVARPLVRRFSISRPPWLSPWALALYAAALAGAVLGIVALRTRALRRTAQLLEEKVTARTKELSQANSELVAAQRDADRIFSALAEVLEGKVLDGRYRLEETIGRGGFGAVFRATDVKQGEPVAVKVFRPQAGNQSAEALARFLQEARSTQQVHHKNAVAVLDSGVWEGIAYTVMELLRGRSLKDELARAAPLAPQRAAAIATQMLGALAEAHRKGIVHRDIKPENVFLQEAGAGEQVKVLDFGVAKSRDAAADGHRLTMTGAMVGTPVYMAPERLEDKPYDGRSDVYSVGVVLYEMLVGRPPFESKDGALWPLILAHVKEAPRPPREAVPSVPEGLSAAVLAALAKDPAQRPTAEALVGLLARAAEEPLPTVASA